ncbi:MAG: hypothetical protein ABIG37_00665 [Nanoarchaeota archaeon]|nr:hypothetical protein [Nanoarchaeota archaeon]
MMMKNKKGWLRIAEAFLAILLITGVLIFLNTGFDYSNKKTDEIYFLEKSILNEISNNQTLRGNILQDNPNIELIENEIKYRIPLIFNFSVMVCEIYEICNPDFYYEEVYAKEKIISSTLQKYEPKKVKIFLWKRK